MKIKYIDEEQKINNNNNNSNNNNNNNNRHNSNNFNGRIYKALTILIFGVVLLFLMEGMHMLRSDECFAQVGYFKNVIQRDDKNVIPTDEVTSDEQANKNQYYEITQKPFIQLTTSPSYTTKNSNEVNQQNNDFIQDVDSQTIRQQRLRDFCRNKYKMKTSTDKDDIDFHSLLYSDRQGVLYCAVAKVACTNWKRIFLVFEGKKQKPLDIPRKEDVHKLTYPSFSNLNANNKEWRKNMYYSFMFVRHPFERILSAYRNKLQDPYNPLFQRKYGSAILKLYRSNLTKAEYHAGRNVTFEEFTKYIIRTFEISGTKALNEHWRDIHSVCSPCTMKYNYIGKMETLVDDAEKVLKEIGVNDEIKFPANATDKYKIKTAHITKEYYGKLSKDIINKLYDIYADDFVSFGYSAHEYL